MPSIQQCKSLDCVLPLIPVIRGGPRLYCSKQCQRRHESQIRRLDERYRETENARRRRRYQDATPDERRRYIDAAVGRSLERKLKAVGITEETYREYEERGCALCGVFASPNGRRLSIDHDHRTGAFRGVLCNPCNTGLGLYRDDPQLLRDAASYLEAFTNQTQTEARIINCPTQSPTG